MRAPRQPRKLRSISPADHTQQQASDSRSRDLPAGQGATTADSVETAAYAHSAPAAETAPVATYDSAELDFDKDEIAHAEAEQRSRFRGLTAPFARVKERLEQRASLVDADSESEQHSEYHEWRQKLAAAMPAKREVGKSGGAKKKSSNVLSLNDRLTEQRHEVRKVRIKKLAIALALAGFLAFTTWLLLFSPLLRISASNISVNYDGPTNTAGETQVNSVLSQYEGEQLLRINRGELEEALEAIPEVAQADVSASPFSGLVVEIKPQYPVVCVNKNNACVPLSAKGEELHLPAEMTQNLPVLENIPDGMDAQRALKDINQLFGYLNTDLAAQVARVKVSSGYQMTFVFKDGREVFWGISKDGDAKARVLRSILAEPKSKIDVSVPGAPVAK
ncbi:cell division septal protein FtsQ [Arcanobacterium pluranimalium]|uniref:cell division protein FtsQ/DivIB n=1 Tax=Arcanobacterium pluranimalium TaxID=108028 RepID=UPI00195871E3|nr:cell division protein FtsQ/DivIB [Arcanobacterium pluranimalium]MBM7825592.1 cell division septal protein FtsQ [Arcanobacterium pluranimalium]